MTYLCFCSPHYSSKTSSMAVGTSRSDPDSTWSSKKASFSPTSPLLSPLPCSVSRRSETPLLGCLSALPWYERLKKREKILRSPRLCFHIFFCLCVGHLFIFILARMGEPTVWIFYYISKGVTRRGLFGNK